MSADSWIFGYGSLVWRPDFPHVDQRTGWIEGHVRRFWQGSTDHRGVPGAPGRVVTLVPEPGGRCWGLVYRVAPVERDAVLTRLDRRESGGFERDDVLVHTGGAVPVEALVYVAGPSNPNYLGPAPLDAIAGQVRAARGPSGANAEYVLQLAAALREIGGEDPHVEALARLVEVP